MMCEATSRTSFNGTEISRCSHNASSSDAGYEKRGMVDGRMTVEKYNRLDHTGEYAVVVAGRYIVQAKGRADIGTLKAAAQAVDWTRLEAMAKG